MKKTLIALAVTSIAATSAMATDNGPQVFGEAKYETGSLDGNGVNSFNGTRIGVKGTKDLGDGLKGTYRLQGNIGSIGSDFGFNEEVWAGLKGSFGEIRAGNSDTATKQSIKPFRAFTDTLVDDAFAKPGQWSRATGWHYQNKFDAVKVYATYAPNGAGMNSTMDASITYKANGLYLSAAMQMIGDTINSTTGDDNKVDGTNMSLGAQYTIGALDFGVLYQTIETKTNGYTGSLKTFTDKDDATNTVAATQVTVPVNYKLTEKLNLRASMVQTDKMSITSGKYDSTTDYAIGAEYFFAKNTNFFATYWTGDKTEAANLSNAKDVDGTTTKAGNASFGFGLSHKF